MNMYNVSLLSCHFILGALTAPSCYPDEKLLVGLTRLDCLGSEESLLDCPQEDVEQDECGLYEDAAVVCQGNNALCPD